MRPKLKISQRSYPPVREQCIVKSEQFRKNLEEPVSMIEDEILNHPIGEELMSNSCIAPDAGDTESAKEKDERSILDEPMVAKALELFAPKKVRVKRKS